MAALTGVIAFCAQRYNGQRASRAALPARRSEMSVQRRSGRPTGVQPRRTAMSINQAALPQVVSRDEWLVARKRLLAEEKELSHARDAVNAARRRLPMVRIDKEYVFEGPAGPVETARSVRGSTATHRLSLHVRPELGGRLSQLFARRRQPGASRSSARAQHIARAHLACTARQDRAVQAAHGVVRPVVLVVRKRLQLRLSCHVERGSRPGGVQLRREGRARKQG